MLIEELTALKDYRTETLYLAVSVADRYLAKLARQKKQAPCLILLAATCILIAAKMEQPKCPSFGNMVDLLFVRHGVKLGARDVVCMEERILLALEFDLQSVTPLLFLERFIRVFGLDQSALGSEGQQIECLALQYCMFSQRYPRFLDLLPSQVAAASILAAINISISNAASHLRGMKTIDERRLRDHVFDVNVHGTLDH